MPMSSSALLSGLLKVPYDGNTTTNKGVRTMLQEP